MVLILFGKPMNKHPETDIFEDFKKTIRNNIVSQSHRQRFGIFA